MQERVFGMKSSWARVLAVVLCLMMYCTAAMAEKQDNRDKSCNFKNIKTVVLCNMDFSQVNLDSHILEKELSGLYEGKSSESKLNVLNGEQLARKISLSTGQDLDMLEKNDKETYNKICGEYLPEYADAYVVGQLVEYKTQTVHHTVESSWSVDNGSSANSDWEKQWDAMWDDSDKTKGISVRKRVEYKEYDSTEFEVTVEFHVYDSKTNKEIFSRRDSRSKQTDDGEEMFNRICENFFHDFGKLTR